MESHKLYFKNREGVELSGRLDMPADQKPHNFALFAHCFTCNKSFHAVRNVSRALTSRGFGVLQFDFTGLGASKGGFSESTFSGNVEDLISAARANKPERNMQSSRQAIGLVNVLFKKAFRRTSTRIAYRISG